MDRRVADALEKLRQAEAELAGLVGASVDSVHDPDTGTSWVLGEAREAVHRVFVRYQRIMNRLASMVFELEADGQVHFVNEPAAAATGYEPEELEGRNWWDTFFPEPSPDRAALEADMAAGDVFEQQAAVQTRRGAAIWSVTSANWYDDDGAVDRFLIFATDITRQMHQAEEARRLEERYKRLFEAIGEGVYEIDAEGRCTALNSAAAHMLGYRKDELLGCRMHDRIHYKRRDGRPHPASDCEILKAIQKGEPHFSVDDTLWRKDGQPLWVALSAVPIYWEGQVAGAAVSFADVSRLKHAEEENSLLLQSLDERVRHLRCLHEAARLFHLNNRGLPEQFETLVHLLAKASRYPALCAAQIVYDGQRFDSQPLQRVRRIESVPIDVSDGTQGHVALCYGDEIAENDLATVCHAEHGLLSSFSELLQGYLERHAAERRVVAQERLLDRILELLPVPVCLAGADGSLTRVNAAARTLFGDDPVTNRQCGTLRKRWSSSGEPVDEHEWALSRCIRTGEPVQNDLVDIETFDGRRVTTLTAVAPVHDAAGKVVSYVMVCQDITEIRDAQRALRDVLERQTSILNALPAHIALLDPAGTVVSVNTAWRRFAQTNAYTGASFGVGVNYIDVCDKAFGDCSEEAPIVAQALRDVLAGRRAFFELEYPCHSPTEQRWFRIMITPLQPGEPSGAVITHVNVTERRLAENEVRGQKELLETILDNIPVMIAFVGPDGRFKWVNRHWQTTMGWTLEEAAGTGMLELLYPDAEYRDRVLSYILNPPGDWNEFRVIRRDGQEIDALWANILLSDGTSVGIGQDITERKALERQLVQSQKMESIGRLAGGVAHDFNNVLSVILGYAELLLDDLPADAPLREDVLQIRDAGERAANLTRQLLAFARKQVVEPEIVDVNNLIQGMHKLLRRLIGEDIELVSVLDAAQAKVTIDPGQFEQVLVNLAVNARDAMPKGGKLTIETADIELDEAFCARHELPISGAYVHIRVRDTGTGMPPSVVQRIFEPFYTTKEAGKGTGLGLATCYGIITQAGGHIGVDSTVGEGTVFHVYLPSDAAGIESVDSSTAAAQTLEGSETILVVEDEITIRTITERALTVFGYRVLTADSGAAALDVAKAFDGPIHLLLTDVIMPFMGGSELAEAMVKLRPDIRVLFMSGYTDDALSRGYVLKAGVNFLSKPFTPRQLAERIRELLDTK